MGYAHVIEAFSLGFWAGSGPLFTASFEFVTDSHNLALFTNTIGTFVLMPATSHTTSDPHNGSSDDYTLPLWEPEAVQRFEMATCGMAVEQSIQGDGLSARFTNVPQ